MEQENNIITYCARITKNNSVYFYIGQEKLLLLSNDYL